MTAELDMRLIKTFTDPAKLRALQERCFRAVIDGAMGNTPIILAAELEKDGGVCPKCDTPFLRRETKYIAKDGTTFGPVAFYEPGCRCFPRCEKLWTSYFDKEVKRTIHAYMQGCGRYLIAETFLGMEYCLNCRSEPPERQERRRKVAAEKKADGKAAAAGDHEERNP